MILGRLQTEEALRVSEHHPLVTTSREGCVTHCRCGWVSDLFRTGEGASASWASHVATEEELKREQEHE